MTTSKLDQAWSDAVVEKAINHFWSHLVRLARYHATDETVFKTLSEMIEKNFLGSRNFSEGDFNDRLYGEDWESRTEIDDILQHNSDRIQQELQSRCETLGLVIEVTIQAITEDRVRHRDTGESSWRPRGGWVQQPERYSKTYLQLGTSSETKTYSSKQVKVSSKS